MECACFRQPLCTFRVQSATQYLGHCKSDATKLQDINTSRCSLAGKLCSICLRATRSWRRNTCCVHSIIPLRNDLVLVLRGNIMRLFWRRLLWMVSSLGNVCILCAGEYILCCRANTGTVNVSVLVLRRNVIYFHGSYVWYLVFADWRIKTEENIHTSLNLISSPKDPVLQDMSISCIPFYTFEQTFLDTCFIFRFK